jgi:hypothetical protein
VALLRRALFVARVALAAAAFLPAACFSPMQPPCAFSCADDGVCPAGFTCQADGVCHRDDGPATCDIPPQIDAGDAAATDGSGADGATAASGGGAQP